MKFLPEEILNFVSEQFKVLREDEIWNIARNIAGITGCRAIDSYYIATAKKTNSTFYVTYVNLMFNYCT